MPTCACTWQARNFYLEAAGTAARPRAVLQTVRERTTDQGSGSAMLPRLRRFCLAGNQCRRFYLTCLLAFARLRRFCRMRARQFRPPSLNCTRQSGARRPPRASQQTTEKHGKRRIISAFCRRPDDIFQQARCCFVIQSRENLLSKNIFQQANYALRAIRHTRLPAFDPALISLSFSAACFACSVPPI
jgi:hypothetical protein